MTLQQYLSTFPWPQGISKLHSFPFLDTIFPSLPLYSSPSCFFHYTLQNYLRHARGSWDVAIYHFSFRFFTIYVFNIIIILHFGATALQNKQNAMCAQRGSRSSCAFAQSDQSLRYAHNRKLRTKVFFMRTAKTDQAGRISRLIWVFSECTDHFVDFVVLRFQNSYLIKTQNSCSQ